MTQGKLQIFNFKNLLLGVSKFCQLPENDILKSIGLKEIDLHNNSGYINAEYGIRLWEFGLEKNDYIGLEVARGNNLMVGGTILINLITAYRTYEDAALSLCKFSAFMGNVIVWNYANGAISFDAIWKDDYPQIFRGAIEMNIMMVFVIARQISGQKLNAKKIEVSYSEKSKQYSQLTDLRAHYQAAFKFNDYECPVSFNKKKNAVVFEIKDIRALNPYFENPNISRQVEELLEDQIKGNDIELSMPDKCQILLKKALLKDQAKKVDVNFLADEVGMKVSTLRKQLKTHNTNYLLLLNNVRLEIYEEQKIKHIPDKVIWSKLGFKDDHAKTSFSHWKTRNRLTRKLK